MGLLQLLGAKPGGAGLGQRRRPLVWRRVAHRFGDGLEPLRGLLELAQIEQRDGAAMARGFATAQILPTQCRLQGRIRILLRQARAFFVGSVAAIDPHRCGEDRQRDDGNRRAQDCRAGNS